MAVDDEFADAEEGKLIAEEQGLTLRIRNWPALLRSAKGIFKPEVQTATSETA